MAIFLHGSRSKGDTIGGAKIFFASEILKDIYADLKEKPLANKIVPENFPLIRILQIFIHSYDKITGIPSMLDCCVSTYQKLLKNGNLSEHNRNFILRELRNEQLKKLLSKEKEKKKAKGKKG
jgi:hypothetical protein